MNYELEPDENILIFAELEKYFHTKYFKNYLAEDLMSLPHVKRMNEYFGDDFQLVIKYAVGEFGSDFINRKIINNIKKLG